LQPPLGIRAGLEVCLIALPATVQQRLDKMGLEHAHIVVSIPLSLQIDQAIPVADKSRFLLRTLQVLQTIKRMLSVCEPPVW
jgi:hypothetical protein